MTKRILELRVIDIEASEKFKHTPGKYVLTFMLNEPNEKEEVRTEEKAYDPKKFDRTKMKYSNSVLFKCAVVGDTSVSVALGKIKDKSKGGAILAKIFSGITGLAKFPAKTTLPGLILGTVFGGIADNAKKTSEDTSAEMIASDEYDIPTTLSAGEIPLVLEAVGGDLKVTYNEDDSWTNPDEDLDDKEESTVTFIEGERVCKVILSMTVL